ncbi:archaellin/type IV pilin N-terminal domain-containing protein [Sulfolobus tengchongensis]|uniref:Archaellin/type IV pilin N-terminal domain-containing protein n=1 Tax=Sulfolobus tengchongensis TaxID=207809 RepID=A0AAX4KY75_9CREN
MKKGISSILGAIILIQIVVLSLSLILYLTSLNAKIYSTGYSQIYNELQKTPISVIPTYQGPMIVSSSASQLIIKYIIYPNGQVNSVNIPVTQMGTYINFQNNPWAIIVLNDGNWYNISYNDRLVNPNTTALGGIKIYSPYSYVITQKGTIDTTYIITPPIYGNDVNPSEWNLLSDTPSSITPYGIQNAVILVPETMGSLTIPINVNLTSSNPFFDIVVPYNSQVFVAVPPYFTPGIYYPSSAPQLSYYLPLEFSISEQKEYIVPVYNATFKYSSYVDAATYLVRLSYVTYNMIYFMEQNGNVIKNGGATIQLLNYTFLGYIVASKIDYGSVEFGVYTTLSGEYVTSVAIPGYNNYTLYSNSEIINSEYDIISSSGIISPTPIIEQILGSPEYLNVANITSKQSIVVSMMISGGNLNYNISNNELIPIPNVMNYTYFWYFFTSPNNSTCTHFLVSITPTSQITVTIQTGTNQIEYPTISYISYILAKKYSKSVNNADYPPINNVVENYEFGTLMYGNSEGYLPLGYPVVHATYYYNYFGYGFSYSETASYSYFEPIISEINYNAPFMILVPTDVYYPYPT